MKLRNLASGLGVAVLFAFALAAGLRGIDFGWHWDEDRLLESMQSSVRDGTLLPGRYNYPSLGYAITLSGALPEARAAIGEARQVMASAADKGARKDSLAAIATRLAGVVDRPAYKLRVRTLFLLLSLLVIPWVFFAARAAGAGRGEALLAAALLATSWEVGYHARWMAPDAVLMQFTALALALALAARRADRHAWRWLAGAAIATGLAMGTKYQGVLLLAPLLLVALTRARTESRGVASALVTRLLPLALLAVATFLFTSPGVVLQPMRCAYDLLFELHHYHTGHGAETVAPGLDHLRHLLDWLALASLSRWAPLAAIAFVAALAGEVELFRRDRLAATILVLVPALAFLTMAPLRVMIARNLLFLLPVLAILAARGFGAVARALPGRLAPALPWLVAGGIVVANAAWLWSAADSIATRHAHGPRAGVAHWLAANPRETITCSRGAWALLSPAERARANVTADSARATRVLLLTSDVRGEPYGNRHGVYEVVAGAYEVNLDWYPNWAGEPHVVALRARDAARMRWWPVPDSGAAAPDSTSGWRGTAAAR